ncbi:MAG: hypothetical protein METHP_00549 [Methanoregula sp. SKADARSKE-2]|nr:MAG: hypothetical protein METHP_00549 [Methanoregula sp. SKADARSKE-2]
MERRYFFLVACLAAMLVLSAGCTQQSPAGTATPTGTQATAPAETSATLTAASSPAEPKTSVTVAPPGSMQQVRLETSMGNITLALDPEMPITTGNFVKLVSAGYYNGVIFHRVIDGFMIQGGDPTGTGRGDPGYTIPDEFTEKRRNNRGTIAMANAGPNTGGSQFFINLVNNNFLDGKHPVFGEVVEGMEVVDAIGKVATGPENRPVQTVTIIKAELV